MNKTLFMASLKANWKLLTGTFLILLMYQSVILGMYDPENVEAMRSMVEALPESLSAAFGYDVLAVDLTSHIGAYLYGFIFLIFPLVYMVPAANNLIAKHVDKGSIVYMLATPNTRKTLAITQAAFMAGSTLILFLSVILTGIVMSESMFPGELIYRDYMLLNLVTVAVHLVLGGIAFLASSIFSESRHSVAVGLGFPLAFLLFKMLSDTGDKLEPLKYASLFSLIDVYRIFDDTSYALTSSALLILAAFFCFAAAVYIFDKRSLNV